MYEYLLKTRDLSQRSHSRVTWKLLWATCRCLVSTDKSKAPVCVYVRVCVCMCVRVYVCVCAGVCAFLFLPYLSSMQIACEILYCMWPVRLYNIFPHCLINGTIFIIKLLNIKCVFWFSVFFFSNISHSKNKWRNIIINVQRSSFTVPLILNDSLFTNLMHKFFILIRLLYSSTCFEHYYAHLQKDKLYYYSIWYRYCL